MRLAPLPACLPAAESGGVRLPVCSPCGVRLGPGRRVAESPRRAALTALQGPSKAKAIARSASKGSLADSGGGEGGGAVAVAKATAKRKGTAVGGGSGANSAGGARDDADAAPAAKRPRATPARFSGGG